MVPPLIAARMTDAAIIDYFTTVARATGGIGLVLQDEPDVTGVRLSPATMNEIFNASADYRWAKVEQIPSAVKIAQVKSVLTRRDVGLYGSRGGLEVLDELMSGSVGVMTGFAYPEALVEILARWLADDKAGAIAVYRRYLPLLVFESQKDLTLGIRKEILCDRGALTYATQRVPGIPPTPEVRSRLRVWREAVERP
jgi:4-hydroxy-tetrahydrodipicolinate synthase